MTEEPKNETSAVDLFLKADAKIDVIREKAERLMVEDLDIKHKMDLVIQRQDQLKERFEHSSSTGHKTWELVQKMAGDVATIATKQTLVEARVETAAVLAEKVDKRFDRMIMGIFITVFTSIILGVMTFLWTKGSP